MKSSSGITYKLDGRKVVRPKPPHSANSTKEIDDNRRAQHSYDQMQTDLEDVMSWMNNASAIDNGTEFKDMRRPRRPKLKNRPTKHDVASDFSRPQKPSRPGTFAIMMPGKKAEYLGDVKQYRTDLAGYRADVRNELQEREARFDQAVASYPSRYSDWQKDGKDFNPELGIVVSDDESNHHNKDIEMKYDPAGLDLQFGASEALLPNGVESMSVQRTIYDGSLEKRASYSKSGQTETFTTHALVTDGYDEHTHEAKIVVNREAGTLTYTYRDYGHYIGRG